MKRQRLLEPEEVAVGEAVIDTFSKFDLRKKFDEFNNRYFDGKIPSDIKLKFKKFKGATGVTRAKVSNIVGGRRRKYIKQENAVITGLSITMSTLIRFDEAEFDKFFLHEMIHAYLFTNGWPYDNHDIEFKDMARDVGQKAGLVIPLTHEFIGGEVISAEDKKLGCLVIHEKRFPEPLFLLFHLKYLDEWVAYVDKMAVVIRLPAEILVVKTRAWALAKVTRKPTRSALRSVTKLKGNIADHLDLKRSLLVKEYNMAPKEVA